MILRRMAMGVAAMTIAATCIAVAPVAAATPLRVCADPDYLPYSNRAGEGFENKIVQVVGKALNRPVEYVWQSTRGGDAFEEMIHQNLNAGKCDMIADIPYADPEVKTTQPYYISSYVFVYKKTSNYAIHSLDSPALHHVKIGYEVETPAEEGLKLRALTIGAKPFFTADQENAAPDAIVKAIEDGTINVGITWDPAVGYFLTQHQNLTAVVVPNSRSQGSPEQYTFPMSMATSSKNAELNQQLNSVIASHLNQLEAVLRSYNILFLEPGVHA